LPLLSPLDTQLPITPARALLTLSGPDDQRTYLFAGTDRGIFRWASDSTGWQPVNHGMPHRDDDSGEASVAVFSLVMDPQSGNLFAGTDYGVFRSSNREARWRPVNSGLPGFDSDTRLTRTRVRALTILVDTASSQTYLFAGS
jgi:ligand-binding sensor domain-containing protein